MCELQNGVESFHNQCKGDTVPLGYLGPNLEGVKP